MPNPRGHASGGGQPPPGGGDRSQQLLDAVNAIAWGVTSLAETIPHLIEALESQSQTCETLAVVSQQLAVLIASEAQRRNTTAENLAQQMLISLGQKVFRGRRK